MNNLTKFERLTLALSSLGAINWGLLTVNQNWNLVEKLANGYNIFSRLLYTIVALAGIYIFVRLIKK